MKSSTTNESLVQVGDLIRWAGPKDIETMSWSDLGIVTQVDHDERIYWAMWLPSGCLGHYKMDGCAVVEIVR